MLRTKRRCLAIEVVGCPRADGRRASYDGSQNKCLLAEVQYAKPVGDEIKASKEEGTGWLKDGWNPHPNRWECGKLQRAKANRIV